MTLVCVYNDGRVLEDCLLTSVRAAQAEAPETEVIAVDNRRGEFASAGAALNHGARRARHDVVVFVHQDVYLHSLVDLERAAGLLLRGDVDVAGAAGITSTGRLAGRIRDRVILAGDPALEPVDVDSLDEVLFAVARSTVLEEPLAEDADLAWHAYAVEYGLRIGRLGGRVAAVDVALTHNSLTTNLARLDVAHASVGARYPERVPVRTTCGVVGGGRRVTLPGPLDGQRWRYRWIKDSLTTSSWHRLHGRRGAVLADVRETVDALLACSPDDTPVAVLNVAGEQDRRPTWTHGGEVALRRRDRAITVGVVGATEVLARVDARPDRSFVVTNVDLELARTLCDDSAGPAFAGFSQGSGAWCVLGPLAVGGAQAFTGPRHRPVDLRLRVPTLVGASGRSA
ncbi:glycosyltransferase family 2 protein [Microlunatus sagamiharensis]|uniref:glycosyltransferase family 2 protein n=1 Tax=Microlunatus sagamiharensis TaxID=546874 RepID=UPI0012FDA8EB|nr:glycosyltransferase family A protein [Microlunatus sagamiharensis]